MGNFFEYITKVTRNAIIRPFRVFYRKIRKRLLVKNRIGRFIKGAVKGLQQSATYEANSRKAYLKVGRRYIAKRFLIILLLIMILVPVGIYLYILPWAAGKLYTPTYTLTDARVKSHNGSVKLVSVIGRRLYEGNMENGMASGYGLLYDAEGLLHYDGDFSNDMYAGQGKLYNDGILVYEGDFSANVFNGHGKTYYENGEISYDGNFSEGAFNGNGKLYRPDGSLKYKGSFENGYYHGFGIELDEDGNEIYEGSYELGQKTGEGQMYLSNGNIKYEGDFKNDLPSGEGLLYHDNGRLRYNGTLEAGLFEGDGKLYTEEGRLIYKGAFSEGAYEGDGELYRPTGRIYYDGLFRDGKFEGEGALYGALGNTLYTGPFHNGEYDVVPLIGGLMTSLGERFTEEGALITDQDDGVNYVLDYDAYNFSVRSEITEDGPVIDGFVFYGAQDYLDIGEGETGEQTVQVLGPLVESETIDPWEAYPWIMNKETPLLDKDADSIYSTESYDYEGLRVFITRNMNTGEILLYEIGVAADEE